MPVHQAITSQKNPCQTAWSRDRAETRRRARRIRTGQILDSLKFDCVTFWHVNHSSRTSCKTFRNCGGFFWPMRALVALVLAGLGPSHLRCELCRARARWVALTARIDLREHDAMHILTWGCAALSFALGAMARNEELDQWVQRYPAPAQGPMHFVSGMFLVNREDTLLTSADGTAWTAHPPAPTWMFQSVANGNGIFVATGFPPKLLTSRDGLTWAADRRFGFEGVAFDGERFVAGANTIATSRDGTTWEAVETSGDVSSFWRIIWANGLYLSTGVDSQYQLAIGDLEGRRDLEARGYSRHHSTPV